MRSSKKRDKRVFLRRRLKEQRGSFFVWEWGRGGGSPVYVFGLRNQLKNGGQRHVVCVCVRVYIFDWFPKVFNYFILFNLIISQPQQQQKGLFSGRPPPSLTSAASAWVVCATATMRIYFHLHSFRRSLRAKNVVVRCCCSEKNSIGPKVFTFTHITHITRAKQAHHTKMWRCWRTTNDAIWLHVTNEL